MAIISTLTNTSTPILADVSGNVYLIGPNAIVTTSLDAVNGANASTSKRIIVQGTLIAEQDGIDLGTAGTAGFNQVHLTSSGTIFAESDGMEIEGPNNSILVEGSIFATSDGLFIVNDNNTVTNFGSIVGGSDGVDFTGTANTLTNHGRIVGGDEGVEIAGNGNRIYNYGEIVGLNNFEGNEAIEANMAADQVFSLFNYGSIAGIGAFAGGAGSETIVNTGTITGSIRMAGGNDVVVNKGVIAGAVDLGAGNDSYRARTDGVVEGILLGGAGDDTMHGASEDDTLDGGDGHDLLGGGAGDDLLTGGLGRDTLRGGAGDDTLIGGAQSDVLGGGQGADLFVFQSPAEIGKSLANGDVITDFQVGIDLIDFSAIDARTTVAGNQAFTFIGQAAFSNEAGQLRWHKSAGNVIGDTDGDGVADLILKLTPGLSVTASDFIL